MSDFSAHLATLREVVDEWVAADSFSNNISEDGGKARWLAARAAYEETVKKSLVLAFISVAEAAEEVNRLWHRYWHPTYEGPRPTNAQRDNAEKRLSAALDNLHRVLQPDPATKEKP